MPGFSTTGAASGAAAGSVIGPWGTVIGGVLGGFFGGGSKAPGTAPYTPVDLQAEQTKALQGDLANQGSIEALLSRSNAFNQGQANSLMEKAMPGYTKLAGQLTQDATDLATNPYDLPPDVQANLTRKAAEMGVSTGRSGQSGDFSLLRDLGVNSLQYGASRISQAGNLTAQLASIAPKVNPMSPMSFYTNPAQQAQLDQSNQMTQQQIAQGGLNAGTAASNYNGANTWQNIADLLTRFGGSKNGPSGPVLPPGTTLTGPGGAPTQDPLFSDPSTNIAMLGR